MQQTRSQLILTVLAAFDPTDQAYWTEDGLPLVEAVQHLANDPTVTRELITSVAPGFSRTNPSLAEGMVLAEAEVAANAASVAPVVTPAPPAPSDAAPQPGATVVTNDPEQAPTNKAEELHNKAQALDNHLQKVRSRMADVNAERNLLQQELNQLSVEEEKIANEIKKLGPRDPNGQAIQSYLARQQSTLAERGARLRHVQASGVDLKALTASLKGAPIDAAMARKNQRGANRPNAPTKK